MSEPQAKTEGRLREARCLERGRGVEAGRLLETPLRAPAGKRRRPPPLCSYECRSRRQLASDESASGRSVVVFRNSVAPQSRRRLALRFCSGESTANVVNTPLPSSTGEMSEPQAKTEGRLRESRYLERGRGVEAGRLLERPLRPSAGKRRRPPLLCSYECQSRRQLADGESDSGRSVVVFRNSVAPQSRRRLALRFCSSDFGRYRSLSHLPARRRRSPRQCRSKWDVLGFTPRLPRRRLGSPGVT